MMLALDVKPLKEELPLPAPLGIAPFFFPVKSIRGSMLLRIEGDHESSCTGWRVSGVGILTLSFRFTSSKCKPKRSSSSSTSTSSGTGGV